MHDTMPRLLRVHMFMTSFLHIHVRMQCTHIYYSHITYITCIILYHLSLDYRIHTASYIMYIQHIRFVYYLNIVLIIILTAYYSLDTTCHFATNQPIKRKGS